MVDKKRKYPLTLPSDLLIRGLGLLTDETDFRLSWLINQKLTIQLKKQPEWPLRNSQFPVTQFFSLYSTHSAETNIFLINNRSSEGAWLTIYHQIDFILMLTGLESDQLAKMMESQLKLMKPAIRAVFRLDPDHLSHLIL